MRNLLQYLSFLLVLYVLLSFKSYAAIDYEVRTIQQIRVAGFLDIDIEIRSTGTTAFNLGTSAFVFNYNTNGLHASGLAAQRKVAANDGPWDAATLDDYADIGTSAPQNGVIGLIVDINTNGSTATGITVPSEFTRIGTLRLIIDHSDLSSQLTWRNIGINTQVQRFTNPGGEPYWGMTDITGNGHFSNLADAPLPVELSSFTASITNNTVNLEWTTATEVNNYGFDIERKIQDVDWQKIGFVEGNGNSNSPKEYSFIDENPPVGNLQYRLKQIDTDGQYEYYETIAEVNFSATATDVEGKNLPKDFNLSQNYPNPFNPATVINYELPATSLVQIKVYDILGNEIEELVNEIRAPGYYQIEFDGSKLSSGVYIYRLIAGSFVETRKMNLLK